MKKQKNTDYFAYIMMHIFIIPYVALLAFLTTIVFSQCDNTQAIFWISAIIYEFTLIPIYFYFKRKHPKFLKWMVEDNSSWDWFWSKKGKKITFNSLNRNRFDPTAWRKKKK